ncbi:MAG: hypothetical protein JXR94_10725 [Candidatus Hydrogenedentes bacterium]|nr:hypothetical protein [Candidatus Hydrogenedentota bacterium]
MGAPEATNAGPTTGQHLRRNTRSSILLFGITQGLKFLQVPIVIACIQEGYTLVRVAFIFFAYFSIYNFGITTAYVKYTAECHAKNDYERLSRLLSTGMALCAAIGVVTIAVVFLFLDPITGFFHVEPQYYLSARFVLGFIAIVAMVNVVLGGYRAALTGIQRIDVVNNCRLIFSLMEFALVVALLYSGFGIRTVVVVYGISVVGPLFVMPFFLRRYLPAVHINPLRPSREVLGPLFSLGGRMQVLGMLALLVNSFDTLVLLRYEALAFTTAYVVSRALVDRLQAVPVQGFGPLIAASADLHSREEEEKTLRVFASALRLTAVATSYIFAFTAVNSDLVFLGYVGPLEYSSAGSQTLMFLSLAAIIHTCTGPGSSMLRGACKPLLETCFHITTLILFATVFAIGKAMQRPELIVLAFPVAIACASFVFLILANRHFKTPLLCPLTSAFLPIAASFAVAGIIRWGWSLTPFSEEPSRWTIVIGVCCMGVVYTALFAPAAWFLPGLTLQDKDQLVRFVPYGRRVLALFGKDKLI